MGLYNMDAFSVTLNNAFSKRKAKYISEPFQLFPKTEEEQKREAEETKRKLIARLDAWKKAFDENNSHQE